MKKMSLLIDGEGIDSLTLLLAVRWLTDPLRNQIVEKHEQVVEVTIFNSVKVIWNTVQQRRFEALYEMDKRRGGDVFAAMLYDKLKSAIFVETYATLQNRVVVCPHHIEDEAGPKVVNEVEVDKKLSYNKKNIQKIISEYREHEEDLARFARSHGNIEEHVKRILEQAVAPRIASNFLMMAEVAAVLDVVKSDIGNVKDAVHNDDGGLATKKDVDDLKKLIQSLGGSASTNDLS